MATKICPTCGLQYPESATLCSVDRTALEAEVDPYLGALVAGRYRIETQLGEGGMATVYRARIALQERPVTVKLYRREFALDPKLRERFRREATNTARLAHPNIIEILDSGETEDGTPYIVMEFLEGETLEAVLKRGPVALPRALEIVRQVLSALARAHDFQVLHRDLKPDNLFVCRADDGADFVKILDFGIARSMHDPRLTGTGEVFGTPQYMAPERISSIDTGPAADLYAMGVILFELATGRLPFLANDAKGYLLKHLREPPPLPRKFNPGLPRPLETLILRLLDKDPERRPVDAHAVLKDLTAIAGTMPRPEPAARPTPPAPPPPPPPSAPVAQPARPATAALTPASYERWERRVGVLGHALATAFGATPPRADLSDLLARVRASLGRMAGVRQRSLGEQGRVDALVQRAREAQGRFGHAMDALGKDLSGTREEVQRVREIERQHAAVADQTRAAFAPVHAALAASAAIPTAELAGLYRAGLDALTRAADAAAEHARAAVYLQAKEREAADTAFQIEELRAQLARLSQASEDERGVIQQQLGAMASEAAAIEQALIADASALANVLRGRDDLAVLLRELEADAA